MSLENLPSFAEGEHPAVPNYTTVIYNGLRAVVVYTDQYWNPVNRDVADQMVVTYYDGGQDILVGPKYAKR